MSPTPCRGKGRIILVLGMYPNLIIAKESIHEGKNLMAHTFVYDLVNERRRVIFFGTEND